MKYWWLPDELLDIGIVSTREIIVNNTTYEAGDDLSALFFVTRDDIPTTSQTIEEFIASLADDSESFSFLGGIIYFHLDQEPDERIMDTFTFKFIFDDGDIVTSSDEIIIY